MSQQLAFWYKVMDLEIPHAVTMTGGIYRWHDGREVPDTMNVAMDHASERALLFSWDSGFGNNQLGVTEDVLGTDGTIFKGPADPLSAAEESTAPTASRCSARLPRRLVRTCRISSTASGPASRRTARSRSVTAFPSHAAWRSKATTPGARFAGTRLTEEIV